MIAKIGIARPVSSLLNSPERASRNAASYGNHRARFGEYAGGTHHWRGIRKALYVGDPQNTFTGTSTRTSTATNTNTATGTATNTGGSNTGEATILCAFSGYVQKNAYDDHQKISGMFSVMRNESQTYPERRGFMKFDTSAIPEWAVITGITMHYYLADAPDFSVCRIKCIDRDPEIEPAQSLFNDYSSGDYSLLNPMNATPGPRTHTFKDFSICEVMLAINICYALHPDYLAFNYYYC